MVVHYRVVANNLIHIHVVLLGHLNEIVDFNILNACECFSITNNNKMSNSYRLKQNKIPVNSHDVEKA